MYSPTCPPTRMLRHAVSQECTHSYMLSHKSTHTHTDASPPAQALSSSSSAITRLPVTPPPQAIQPRLPSFLSRGNPIVGSLITSQSPHNHLTITSCGLPQHSQSNDIPHHYFQWHRSSSELLAARLTQLPYHMAMWPSTASQSSANPHHCMWYRTPSEWSCCLA